MAAYKEIVLTIVVLCSILAPNGSMGEPVLGDIQLVPSTISGYYQPLVYFTNGIQPPQWGSICYDSIVKADVKVICNQVGFELDDHSPFMGSDYTDNSYPIWFDDVSCDENKQQQHILSCNYKVVFGTQRYKWPCGTNEYLIVNCDMTKPLISGIYDSQLLLCPPDQADDISGIYSTSFGLVVMYSSKYGIWRGLNQPNDSAALGGNEADTICRQLGFTDAVPGSAVTERAMLPNNTFKHCYDNSPPFKVQSQAWLSTDVIHCTASQKCLGCCYEYPSRDNCGECDNLNDIVIQCIFIPDQFSSDSGGSNNDCAYDSLLCNTECASEAKKSESLTIALIVMTLLCVLLLIVVIMFYPVYKQCKRNAEGAAGGGDNGGDNDNNGGGAGGFGHYGAANGAGGGGGGAHGQRQLIERQPEERDNLLPPQH